MEKCRYGRSMGNFLLLPEEDLFFKISKVYQRWRYVCWEILFWINYHTIDFSELKEVLYQGYSPRRIMSKSKHAHICGTYFGEFGISLQYENILLHGLNWILDSVAYRDRRNYVTEVILPCNIYTDDDNLVHISKRYYFLALYIAFI